MCVICISDKGTRQPNRAEFEEMFFGNPDGAGYMFARDGQVHIHKGFMTLEDFLIAVNSERFTDDDVVVYHFRISTQGGVNPQMCQPFALTKELVKTECLDVLARVGVVHNGIIPMTSIRGFSYSDTALFVADYLSVLIKSVSDVHKTQILDIIEELIKSKMVLLDCFGNYETIGKFERVDGLLYSNLYHKSRRFVLNAAVAAK